MIKNIVVEVEPRNDLGKNASRRFRRVGKVPAVIYGGGETPVSVLLSPRRVDEILRLETGRNTIFTVSLAGESQSGAVMIKDLSRDPVSESFLHVDLVRVRLDRAVQVKVPVRLLGLAEGVKNEGGIVEFVLREVEVECLPAEIPEHLDVDVSGLHINQHVSVGQLAVKDTVKILDDPEGIVVVIAPPKAEEEAAPAEGAEVEAAAQEPTVIKKGKEATEAQEPQAKEKPAKEKPAKEK